MEIIICIIWMLCVLVATMIGSKKGEGVFGFIAGFLLGPIGVLMGHFQQRRSEVMLVL